MSNVESGWTLYLHDDDGETECSVSAGVPPGSYRQGWNRKAEEDEDDDENLSMVSDASSGPPCFSEAEDWSGHVAGGGGGGRFQGGSEQSNEKMEKKKKNERRQRSRGGRHSDNYEDTACSLQKNFNVPKDHSPISRHALDYLQGYSIPNIQGVSEYGKHQLPPGAEQKATSRKSSGQSRKFM